ncbi:hypothetical protein KAI92_03385 [Candidatus Parcubacteria bacterium]|nr:hypothetical protein [Candidatus Parcubacteria bacterium]
MTKTDLFLSEDSNDEGDVLFDKVDLSDNLRDENIPHQSKDLDEGVITISASKAILINKLLENIKDSHEKITKLLGGSYDIKPEEVSNFTNEIHSAKSVSVDDGRIVEGIFDGENMIGPDGKQYSIPANYASKSKLVEGDILKLTIRDNGSFVYKQIGPIERSRLIGILEKDDAGSFVANIEEKRWKLITASVTYFRGQTGDEIVILVPKNGESKWAAVENIVRNVN